AQLRRGRRGRGRQRRRRRPFRRVEDFLLAVCAHQPGDLALGDEERREGQLQTQGLGRLGHDGAGQAVAVAQPDDLRPRQDRKEGEGEDDSGRPPPHVTSPQVRHRVASPPATTLKRSSKQPLSLQTRTPHSHSQPTSAGPARVRPHTAHAVTEGSSGAGFLGKRAERRAVDARRKYTSELTRLQAAPRIRARWPPATKGAVIPGCAWTDAPAAGPPSSPISRSSLFPRTAPAWRWPLPWPSTP